MSAIVNARDVLLQAAVTRLVTVTLPDTVIVPAVKAITLTAPSLTFQVTNLGVATPTSILLTAALRHIPGSPTVSFSVTSGTATLTGSGLTRTLTYANMSSSYVTIQASVTENSITYTSSVSISKVVDGTNGLPGLPGLPGGTGVRGATRTTRTTAGLSAWSDAEANAAITALGYSNVLMDEVTLRNSVTPTYIETRYWSGSAWLTVGQIVNGNLLVSGTILADAIAANAITSAKIGTNTLSAVNINTTGQIRSTGSYSPDNGIDTSITAAVVGNNSGAGTAEAGVYGYSNKYGGFFRGGSSADTGMGVYATGWYGLYGSSGRTDGSGAGVYGQGNGVNTPGLWCGGNGYYRWGSYNIAPPPGGTTSFLRADGTWQAPVTFPTAASLTSAAAITNTGALNGSSSSAARADHGHNLALPLASSANGNNIVTTGATHGISTTPARSDHTHNFTGTFATATDISTAITNNNINYVSANFSLLGHDHSGTYQVYDANTVKATPDPGGGTSIVAYIGLQMVAGGGVVRIAVYG